MDATELHFRISETVGEVSARLVCPPDAEALLVFAHGAGADMHHRFMEAAAQALAERRVGTFRYQFPYTEAGRKRPDHRNRLIACTRAAVAAAEPYADGRRLLAGGKSMGGRMTSQAAAEGGLDTVAGIVFFGFPLHAAGKPSSERGEHLKETGKPLLFLQGARDRLADLTLLEPLVDELGARARLHVVPDADHSFHVPKRSGRSDDEVLQELADTTASWSRAIR